MNYLDKYNVCRNFVGEFDVFIVTRDDKTIFRCLSKIIKIIKIIGNGLGDGIESNLNAKHCFVLNNFGKGYIWFNYEFFIDGKIYKGDFIYPKKFARYWNKSDSYYEQLYYGMADFIIIFNRWNKIHKNNI